MEFVKFKQNMSVSSILEIIESLKIKYEYKSDSHHIINGISNGLLGVDKTLCFIEYIKSIEQIENMPNSLILTNNDYSDAFKDFNLIYLNDPRYVFIKLLEYFHKNSLLEDFTSAVQYAKTKISKKAVIHPSAILEENVVIEDDAVVSAGCVVKNGTFIGKGSIIRENCIIGCDGIALYKAKNEEVLRFPHVAGVFMDSNVEIGAGCIIVSGTLSNTTIGSNTVIGNLSNIGHGVKIGEKVWISVGSLVGGNTTIKDGVTIGLGTRLKDNIVIGENCSVGMGSVVTKNIPENTSVFGNPAKPLRTLNVGPKR